MTTNNREQDAYNAYRRFLGGKGATQEELDRRCAPLLQLLPALAGMSMDSSLYREQVEHVLDQVERTEWPLFLSAAREFYYFWANDIKAIAAMSRGGAYRVGQLASHVADIDLPTLWSKLDQEKFELAETWPLKGYLSALRDEGAEKSVVETRGKLVKLLLLQLRSAPSKDNHTYRIAVDATLPVFSLRETRMLFQIVVRDFYYFWMGDPDAGSHVTLDIREADG